MLSLGQLLNNNEVSDQVTEGNPFENGLKWLPHKSLPACTLFSIVAPSHWPAILLLSTGKLFHWNHALWLAYALAFTFGFNYCEVFVQLIVAGIFDLVTHLAFFLVFVTFFVLLFDTCPLFGGMYHIYLGLDSIVVRLTKSLFNLVHELFVVGIILISLAKLEQYLRLKLLLIEVTDDQLWLVDIYQWWLLNRETGLMA